MRNTIKHRKQESFVNGDTFEDFLRTLLTEHYNIKSKNELSRIINNVCKITDGNDFMNYYGSFYSRFVSPRDLYYDVINGYKSIEDLIEKWGIDTDLFEKDFLFNHWRDRRINMVLGNN